MQMIYQVTTDLTNQCKVGTDFIKLISHDSCEKNVIVLGKPQYMVNVTYQTLMFVKYANDNIM